MVYILFILGTLLGSFYLLIGSRMPLGEDIVYKRSHCDHCNKELMWYELIPIFSYIFLKGKCSSCKNKLSLLYPVIEIITGITFSLLYLYFGFSYELYVSLIISSLLIIICISDFKYMIILDIPSVIAITLIIMLQLHYHDTNYLISHLASGIVMFAFLYIVKQIGYILFKKESLGDGDIKFGFIIGLVLGLKLTFVTPILAAILAIPTIAAIVLTTKNKEVPFGPFLCGALLIIFINYDKFNNLLDFLQNSIFY